MTDEIARLRSAHMPAHPLWVDERQEDGDFPVAEENMIDHAQAWWCPTDDTARRIEPYRVKIIEWRNSVPVAPEATHIVYAVF